MARSPIPACHQHLPSASPPSPRPSGLRQRWAPTSLSERASALSITCVLCQSHHQSVPSSIWRLVLLPKPSLVVGMGQGGSLAFAGAAVTHPIGKGCGICPWVWGCCGLRGWEHSPALFTGPGFQGERWKVCILPLLLLPSDQTQGVPRVLPCPSPSSFPQPWPVFPMGAGEALCIV